MFPADALLPSLDAGTPDLFKRINRPHPGISFHQHVAGLEAFSREYRGQLLLEVMLIQGLNDRKRPFRIWPLSLTASTPMGFTCPAPIGRR